MVSFKGIIHSIKVYRKIKNLKKYNIIICSAEYISNIDNLILEGNNYIGPKSWMDLRGRIKIGNGTIEIK